jgi:hypothetical protein
MATRLRQSIADFEAAFHEQTEADRQQREEIVRESEVRTHTRQLEKRHRHGTLRFAMLLVLLTATAVAVTIAMFETLYLVMG